MMKSMDVGNSLGVHDQKLLVVEALDGRERVVHEVGDCMGLGGINLEDHHAFTPKTTLKRNEEYVEAV